jgi:hypothetical protein
MGLLFFRILSGKVEIGSGVEVRVGDKERTDDPYYH